MTLGVGAEIGAQIMENAYADLEHPLGRLGIPDTPMASFKHMYQFLIPGVDDIIEKVKKVLHRDCKNCHARIGHSMTEGKVLSGWLKKGGSQSR